MADPGIIPLERAPSLGELALLQRAKALGFPVVPTWAVALEEEFYRLNNLPERIERLFAGVFGVRVDEERLLWAAEEAQRSVRESYLLPERAEAFLEAVKGRGPFVVRPLGGGPHPAPTPQEALFALKRLWAGAFRVEAILERHPRLLPPFIPYLVQEAGEVGEDPFFSLELSKALGERVVVFAHRGVVVRIEWEHGG
ncbi:hypothetical protein [Thermus sp.]|uniref:hypothetical protein n=1 Tax=Thermus sp. TaxID=275 RepID=UPI00307E711C